jgi:hypothetical protein
MRSYQAKSSEKMQICSDEHGTGAIFVLRIFKNLRGDIQAVTSLWGPRDEGWHLWLTRCLTL